MLKSDSSRNGAHCLFDAGTVRSRQVAPSAEALARAEEPRCLFRAAPADRLVGYSHKHQSDENGVIGVQGGLKRFSAPGTRSLQITVTGIQVSEAMDRASPGTLGRR